MFSRFVRPYRKARKYAKKRLFGRKGISFVSMASRARKTMDPPSSSKRRKFGDISQLLTQEDYKDMGMRDPSSMGPSEAPLTKDRFKDPASDSFEFHHFCRRISVGVLTCAGVSGTNGTYSLISTIGGLIADIGTLDNVYERIRITRVQYEFTPLLNDQFSGPSVSTQGTCMIGYYIPRNAQQALSLPVTWADAIDEPTFQVKRGNMPFVVDCIPLICEQDDLAANGVFNVTQADSVKAPWISSAVANATSLYIGQVNWIVPLGVADYTSQAYYITATTWFDMDTQV